MKAGCIKDLSKSELIRAMDELGQPSFRADQIYRWLYGKAVGSFEEMRNLPADLRSSLGDRYTVDAVKKIREMMSRDGTRKYLLRLADGNTIETVLIPATRRSTVCLSSQVGCRFGCPFCASGMGGFQRNLSQGEILDQVIILKREGVAATHAVFMGIGEPLDNYDNLTRAIAILNDRQAFGMGARRITISTCGLVDGIEKLSELGLQVGLSVSLHAPDDGLRDKLMPINRRYPIKELLKACREYYARTNRVITFEYALISGLNDSPGIARRLAAILDGFNCKVNLIKMSQVPAEGILPSPPEAIHRFRSILEERGVKVTVRRQRGADIEAACGQLRLRTL